MNTNKIPMNSKTLERLEATTKVVEAMVSRGDLRCCLSCIHFEARTNQCSKYRVIPPAKVIMFSCGKEWEDDIPF